MKICCPHSDCQQRIEIGEIHAGTTATCPTCGRQFQCPSIDAFVTESHPSTSAAIRPPGETLKAKQPTPKQAALLSYLGIAIPDGKEEASELIDAATENPAHIERLSKWRQDRLKLFPELYGREIREQKEARAQALHSSVNNDVGSEFHPIKRITLAQAKVAVNYLDEQFPDWDAALWEEFGVNVDTVYDWFLPAIARTSPQAVKKAFRGSYSLPASLQQSGQINHRPNSVRRNSSLGCASMVIALIACVVLIGHMLG